MARAIERIERDIAALEEAISVIAVELRSAYATYLTVLMQTMQQQAVLASYHLCTQGYSEPFLRLSFSQRQKLQQALRKLGQQASEQLLVHVEVESVTPTEESTPQPSNPIELSQWLQKLEQLISNTLKTLSCEINRLLQQAEILPKTLPSPILEAAVNASIASSEAVPGPPNLLNLLIETQNQQEQSQDSTITHIIAINLRLSEIEFADATLRARRNQIRNLEVRASSLSREYDKNQRERAVAEAEAAWRASWFEE